MKKEKYQLKRDFYGISIAVVGKHLCSNGFETRTVTIMLITQRYMLPQLFAFAHTVFL